MILSQNDDYNDDDSIPSLFLSFLWKELNWCNRKGGKGEKGLREEIEIKYFLQFDTKFWLVLVLSLLSPCFQVVYN